MFAPKTLPKLNSGVPEIAEEIPTKSSGVEVARAIKINAAENSEICRKRAILVKDLTKNAPLTIKMMHDKAKYKRFSIIISPFLLV